MRWFYLALALIPTSAIAEQGEVFPPVVDGIEYRLTFGSKIRPGWSDGSKSSGTILEECQRRLAFVPGPSVCMVRKAPPASLSI